MKPDWTKLAEAHGPQPAVYTEPETPPPRRQLRLPDPHDARFVGPLIAPEPGKEARHHVESEGRTLPSRER